MKKPFWQRILPHIIAIAVFLIVDIIICKSALDSDLVLKQSDITGWQGMSHQSFQYKEQHGHFPLWVTNMFSGMPGYQIAMEGPITPLHIIGKIAELGLPKPLNFLFIACLSFYIFCMCIRVRPWVAIIGALAFTYCTFTPIIITAGHDTQMHALAWCPAALGSIILLLERRYLLGFVLSTVFLGLQVNANHQQITYYLFLVIGIMCLFFLVRAIREKQALPFFKSAGLIVVAVLVSLALTAVGLLTVSDYAKESKRGGQLVLDNNKSNAIDKQKDDKTQGLSKEYAFQWSYGKAESMSLLFPGVLGYGMHYAERDQEPYLFPKLDENSNFVHHFTDKLNVPEEQAANIGLQFSSRVYWGDQPSTVGPVYLGAIICFLFLFAMFYLDGKHKWWILTASVLAILMAWGDNLPSFNYFLFDYLPFYNKLRVPTMTLVIPQLLFPIAAVLVLEKLVSNPGDPQAFKQFRNASIATGVVFLVGLAMYFSFDYSNENKARTNAFTQAFANPNDPAISAKLEAINKQYIPKKDNQVFENFVMQTKGDIGIAKGALTALREDRKSFFGKDILRSFVYVLIAVALVFLLLKKKINTNIFLAALGLATAIDLLTLDAKYLNSYSYDSKEKYEATEFPLTEADATILKDKDPNYRVFNTASLEESRTSYYHKSIGGYHPAKLGIYDDLMTYQLSGSPNLAVVNMLNVKYIIQQNPQTGASTAFPNPQAFGNCWFVKGVKFVKGAAEEMKALNNLSPLDTAVVDESFRSLATGFTAADSSATIKQVAFDNDAIKYESNSSGSHVAVFSEIYYKDWKAYIDGKPAGWFKTNYVLRGMVLPAGKHTIEFKFEPGVYFLGKTIATIASWIVSLALLAFIIVSVKPLIAKKKEGKSA